MDIKTIKIRRGLNLKVPTNEIASPTLVDLSSTLSATISVFTDHQRLINSLVKKDQLVHLQSPLFTLLDDPKVKFLSPVSGKIVDYLLDGRKRIGVVIKPDTSSSTDPVSLSYNDTTLESVKTSLLESGLWTLFRQRPFSKIPHSSSIPSSVFITAMDTDPLPVDIPFVVSRYDGSHYTKGIEVLSKLSSSIYFCTNKSTFLKLKQMLSFTIEKIRLFEGRYPSCLPGTHIHYLDPVYPKKDHLPFYIDIQDVIRIGKFFTSGSLDFTKILALSGNIKTPTHIKLTLGSSLDVLSSLLTDAINKNDILIGSYLNGRNQTSDPTGSFIGIYDTKISVLSPDNSTTLFGWARPDPGYYSFYNTVISKFIRRTFKFSSKTHGSLKPVFPLESFDKVFPFETSTLFLLKSLLIKDIDMSIKLGCLELDEEDMGLCTFICPSKHDWGSILQEVLKEIEKEESTL